MPPPTRFARRLPTASSVKPGLARTRSSTCPSAIRAVPSPASASTPPSRASSTEGKGNDARATRRAPGLIEVAQRHRRQPQPPLWHRTTPAEQPVPHVGCALRPSAITFKARRAAPESRSSPSRRTSWSTRRGRSDAGTASRSRFPHARTTSMIDVPAMEAAINDQNRRRDHQLAQQPRGLHLLRRQPEGARRRCCERKSAEYGHPIYLLSATSPTASSYYDGGRETRVGAVACTTNDARLPTAWSKSMSAARRAHRLHSSFRRHGRPTSAHGLRRRRAAPGASLGYICDEHAVPAHGRQVHRRTGQQGAVRPSTARSSYEGLEGDRLHLRQAAGRVLHVDQGARARRATRSTRPVAKAHELLLVPSDGFGMKGWVRAGYCCSKETIRGRPHRIPGPLGRVPQLSLGRGGTRSGVPLRIEANRYPWPLGSISGHKKGDACSRSLRMPAESSSTAMDVCWTR